MFDPNPAVSARIEGQPIARCRRSGSERTSPGRSPQPHRPAVCLGVARRWHARRLEALRFRRCGAPLRRRRHSRARGGRNRHLDGSPRQSERGLLLRRCGESEGVAGRPAEVPAAKAAEPGGVGKPPAAGDGDDRTSPRRHRPTASTPVVASVRCASTYRSMAAARVSSTALSVRPPRAAGRREAGPRIRRRRPQTRAVPLEGRRATARWCSAARPGRLCRPAPDRRSARDDGSCVCPAATEGSPVAPR